MSNNASSAYIKLAEYNQRCREQANDLPMQQDAVSYWSGEIGRASCRERV